MRFMRVGWPDRRGFSVVEISVAVLIIGVLAAIAIPNYAKMRAHAQRASCHSNQRNLSTAAGLYAIDKGVGTDTLPAISLLHLGYSAAAVCECPASDVRDFDDYTIVIEDGNVLSITCDIVPIGHQWQVPAP